jgi:hypothetical protein
MNLNPCVESANDPLRDFDLRDSTCCISSRRTDEAIKIVIFNGVTISDDVTPYSDARKLLYDVGPATTCADDAHDHG